MGCTGVGFRCGSCPHRRSSRYAHFARTPAAVGVQCALHGSGGAYRTRAGSAAVQCGRARVCGRMRVRWRVRRHRWQGLRLRGRTAAWCSATSFCASVSNWRRTESYLVSAPLLNRAPPRCACAYVHMRARVSACARVSVQPLRPHGVKRGVPVEGVERAVHVEDLQDVRNTEREAVVGEAALPRTRRTVAAAATAPTPKLCGGGAGSFAPTAGTQATHTRPRPRNGQS
jgi:hypothetical protein